MTRPITSDLRRDIIKVICLTIGLSVGFLLIGRIYLDQTYDTSYPDAGDIYRIYESLERDGEYSEHSFTPGAIAPGLKRYAPQVVTATRYTSLLPTGTIRLDDGRTFEINGAAVTDTCFFDMFNPRILHGNPHEVLAVANSCMIPRSLADKIGGDVTGTSFCILTFSEQYKAIIGGVYEDFPINSSVDNMLMFGIPTMKLLAYDGSENWLGNDCYNSYVKLAKGTDPESLRPYIDRMTQDHINGDVPDNFRFDIHLRPLRGLYASKPGVRTTQWMLGMLAAVMLTCASLNFLLIVIGQMAVRSKEMAVRKCYGTPSSVIFMRVIGESLFFLLLSAVLALLVAFSFSDLCRELLWLTPAQIFSSDKVWLAEGAVCLLLLIITGGIPAWIYCRTPVAEAFREHRGGRKLWKLVLLAVQFFATGMIVCLLTLVGRQYRMITDSDLGFDYRNIGYANLAGIPQEQRHTLIEELKRLGCVESAASAYHDFPFAASGNNVWVNEDWEHQYNVADLYFADPDIFDVMGIRMLQGSTFRAGVDSITRQVIVEERFIEFMHRHFGWEKGNIVGKRFGMSEHTATAGDELEVCGVIADMRRGGFEAEYTDRRPGIIFPSTDISDNLYVRFSQLTPETLAEAQKVITDITRRELYITPYSNTIELFTAPVRNFGKAVTIVGIIVMAIALIGLIGYVADEVNRRRKEIAIRKVTGTPASKIVRLFCRDILAVALPSLAAGGLAAIIVGRRWVSQFTDQVSLAPGVMALCLLALAALIAGVVTLNCLDIARSNPVDHLRTE